MNTIEELKECLALQNEIDAKTMELRSRYKAVIQAEEAKGNKHTIFVEIDGETYALEREDFHQTDYRDAMKTARKLGGFYLYRLFKRGKVIR